MTVSVRDCFFQAEDGIRDKLVTGVQTCALPIYAGASVVAYAHYCEARDAGRAEEAAAILAGISDYNEYDCLSTLELRDWLLRRAEERGISPAAGGTNGPVTAGDGSTVGPGDAAGAVAAEGSGDEKGAAEPVGP